MTTSNFYTILPPSRFGTNHTLADVSSVAANRYVFRVHLSIGQGALTPRGFVASAFTNWRSDAPGESPYSGKELAEVAAAHINQLKHKTWGQPTEFVSCSYSLPYVLFEASRRNSILWNRPDNSEILISIIDLWEIPSDKWLGTELVGAYWKQAPFFSRWAQEVLVFGHIPLAAVTATMSMDSFFDCLPRWCSGVRGDIRQGCLWSTEAVVHHLKILAMDNDTPEERKALLIQSVERSIPALHIPSTSADPIDRTSQLAAIFCWWPRWITGTDPTAYPALFRTVHEKVREYSRFQEMLAIMTAPVRSTSGAVRRQGTSPHGGTPYARPASHR
ncbi:hypothetical protein DFH06DRAFT_468326 [Mycena polygramma]|nr:hypothetical protein DFH06DRAFT_468326 [Mycena polygramma]